MGDDLKAAFRSLTSSKRFTGVALLVMALGIGARTAVFSVVDAVVLRGLPFEDPEQLDAVGERRRALPNALPDPHQAPLTVSSAAPQNYAAGLSVDAAIPRALAAALGVVGGSALAASVIPARRAAAVDPIAAALRPD